jgi:hypothetical protein
VENRNISLEEIIAGLDILATPRNFYFSTTILADGSKQLFYDYFLAGQCPCHFITFSFIARHSSL